MLDFSGVLVADASTVINLNATGCAVAVLSAIPQRVVVVDTVQAELEEGRSKGRRDSEQLRLLVEGGRVEIVTLDKDGLSTFESLVVGPATETLDDGEAATLAYAIQANALPIIDEYKANRLSARRYPSLRLGCTVDLFAHPEVRVSLGEIGLQRAILGALQRARMQVPRQHVEWILSLLGPEEAAQCKSLPEAIRKKLLIGKTAI